MSLGIDTLTLCSLSSNNWESSATDIGSSMKRFLDNLHAELAAPPDSDICIQVIGRLDRFPPQILDRIEKLQDVGKGTHGLTLRLAFDYSSRQMLIEALRHATVNIPLDKSGHHGLASFLGQAMNTGQSSPDVDLMIRTGGEHWLGDSLLWESAYAELFFTPTKWPNFTDKDLAEAIREFHSRERRFGNIVLAS
jgi:undecaprenyl diphosphate synthase